jgi:hypothetical protein
MRRLSFICTLILFGGVSGLGISPNRQSHPIRSLPLKLESVKPGYGVTLEPRQSNIYCGTVFCRVARLAATSLSVRHVALNLPAAGVVLRLPYVVRIQKGLRFAVKWDRNLPSAVQRDVVTGLGLVDGNLSLEECELYLEIRWPFSRCFSEIRVASRQKCEPTYSDPANIRRPALEVGLLQQNLINCCLGNSFKSPPT